eukprot:jgi/Mesvir1/5351/Mv15439-RA.3
MPVPPIMGKHMLPGLSWTTASRRSPFYETMGRHIVRGAAAMVGSHRAAGRWQPKSWPHTRSRVCWRMLAVLFWRMVVVMSLLGHASGPYHVKAGQSHARGAYDARSSHMRMHSRTGARVSGLSRADLQNAIATRLSTALARIDYARHKRGPANWHADWYEAPMMCNCTPIHSRELDAIMMRNPRELAFLSQARQSYATDGSPAPSNNAGYGPSQVRASAGRMGIACAIMLTRAGHADVPAYLRLLRAIYHEDNLVAIHLDAKAPEKEYDALRSAVEGDPLVSRTTFFTRRAPATWGGVSMVTTLLRMMSELLRRDPRWEYCVHLSGSDYPLMTQNAFRQLLASLPAPMDLMHDSEDWLSSPGKVSWYNELWLDPAVTDVILARDTMPSLALRSDSHEPAGLLAERRDRVKIYQYLQPKELLSVQRCKSFPSQYVFSRASVEYLISDPDGVARDALLVQSEAFAPDECMYPTVLANSDMHNRRRVHLGMMCTTWKPGASHPSNLTEKHWEFLKACKTAFARKFVPGNPVLDRIDREFLGNATSNRERVAASLAAINALFVPVEALEFTRPGLIARDAEKGTYGSSDTSDAHTERTVDRGDLVTLNCSAPYVSIRADWASAHELETTKHDCCREPFMKTSQLGVHSGVMKKTVSWGAQNGVTEFDESCCPCHNVQRQQPPS